MRRVLLLIVCLTLICAVPIFAQDQSSPSQGDDPQDKAESSARASEESSSKDTRVDLSPPKDDEKSHPLSGVAVSDAKDAASDVQELHPWDPHKAAKDVEVGDFYFKKKNYRAAMERYKDALFYKPNDAVANFRLGECLEKTGSPQEAVTRYQEYLKILPHGPFSVDAQKALERLETRNPKASAAPAP